MRWEELCAWSENQKVISVLTNTRSLINFRWERRDLHSSSFSLGQLWISLTNIQSVIVYCSFSNINSAEALKTFWRTD